MLAFAEVNDKGNRCNVHFRYDYLTKERVKAIPGARYVGPDKGGPMWSLPLDLISMHALRLVFGNELTLGTALKRWGHRAIREEQKLHTIAAADDWPLEEMKINQKLPKFAKWLRPYQRADIMFLSQTSAMNLLEPRLGKTPETIGAIFEADLEDGPHLVVAPQKTLDSVWRMEFERWTKLPVYTWSGETTTNDRARTIAKLWDHFDDGDAFVLVTTADMIRRGLPDDMELEFEWNTFTIDEFHKTGLPEPKTVFFKKVDEIRKKRVWVLSGTPMGGKPIKLWSPLHLLYPDRFTSKWRWAEQWLDVTTETYVKRNKRTGELEERRSKKIGGIKPGREEQFYQHLSPYAIRRLRTEVLKQLPPVQSIDVWCSMTDNQRKQYETFHRDAEIRIDEHHLSAVGILAEYTRLKQFSNSRCEAEVLSVDEETGRPELKIKPTFDSGKLPFLMERLAEAGIDPEDPWGSEQAIVTSQFREVTDMLYNYLMSQGIECVRITGKVSKKESELAQRVFKAGNDHEGYRVCCMVTTIGVGITLDNVQTVHVFDETWVPDDQEQLIDRAVNTTTNHQITAFYYRSMGTIEEYIADITDQKGKINKEVLDQQRNEMKKRMRA